MDKNISKVKFSIKAPSMEALTVKMLLNSQVNNTMFDYSDPIPVGKDWVCWFRADASKLKRV